MFKDVQKRHMKTCNESVVRKNWKKNGSEWKHLQKSNCFLFKDQRSYDLDTIRDQLKQ